MIARTNMAVALTAWENPWKQMFVRKSAVQVKNGGRMYEKKGIECINRGSNV